MDRNSTQSRESTGQKIESVLLDDIAAGLLQPGERLDETKLAQRFGVSRTPVREALSRLTAQGVLIAGEKRGVRVAEYSREELSQMFEAMQEIESICARLANQRLTLLNRSEIEAAQANCKTAAQANDRIAYIRANEALHMAIYRATDNPYIFELASDFRRKTGPFRAKKLESQADLIASVANHEDLLAKIFSGDSQMAVDGMRQHMTESFMRVLAVNN
ncbi:GntR family transcriptional regulator [Parasulfitobacter algicola]|uniref:GntR family transcriptional regulator n=1 Tax=Parasulfitobacter algicola TaxID=2614809 RepID=A0ABX2ILY2_9RHOB|nr:GntR family transcriptional regulator [Sulfitobacter algicola]NSX53535.1 GntR family transcriptional regulator [Sulfitobacter algicola]